MGVLLGKAGESKRQQELLHVMLASEISLESGKHPKKRRKEHEVTRLHTKRHHETYET